jgi:glucose-6-phosphate isomerase
MEIIKAKTFFDGDRGVLKGDKVSYSERRLKDLEGLFKDKDAYENMPLDTLVYKVEVHEAVKGIPGGLYFGVSHIYPGRVGHEYFMTKGHFHARRDTAEYYWGITGHGILLFMDEKRSIWAEEIIPGSLHYIPGNTAHRLINSGDSELTVGACWPSDAGHDYAAIVKAGFSARILEKNGRPEIHF